MSGTTPFRRGQKALRTESMKRIAKDLATRDPLAAVMSGLRMHTAGPGAPFFLPGADYARLTVLGRFDSGHTRMGPALAQRAADAGYRVVSVIADPQPWFGEDRVWEDDGKTGWVRKGPHGDVRYLPFGRGLFNIKREIDAFLGAALADDRTPHIALRPPAPRAERGDFEACYAEILAGLMAHRASLADCVLVFDDPDAAAAVSAHLIPPATLDALTEASAGVVRALPPGAAAETVRPGDPCVFAIGAGGYADGMDFGEALLGPYGVVPSKEGTVRLPTLIRDRDIHAPAPEIAEIVAKLKSVPGLSRLPHTARLDAVAKACGYFGWHAAEGRR